MLNKMRASVRGHLEDDAQSKFSKNTEKLRIIATVLKKGWVKPKDTVKLQSLGAVLGDVLASEATLDWVVVTDEVGRTPALRYANTSLIMYPLTMISKRVERGETVDVHALLAESLKGVARIKKKLGAQKEAVK